MVEYCHNDKWNVYQWRFYVEDCVTCLIAIEAKKGRIENVTNLSINMFKVLKDAIFFFNFNSSIILHLWLISIQNVGQH